MITHMMLMQLRYPGVSTIFYSKIFEFVSFDLFQTGEIYNEIFKIENDEPYSEQAEELGYESTFLVPNSGPLLLFIAIFAVMLTISLLITSIAKSGKIHNFIKKKR